MSIKDIDNSRQSDEISLDFVYCTGTRSVIVKDKKYLSLIVDEPCLKACEYLYDCNIRTLNSSANRNNISSGEGFITIDYKSLDEVNKSIYQKLVDEGILPNIELKEIEEEIPFNIIVPMNEATTVLGFSEVMLEVVHNFVKQDILYGVYSEEEITKRIINGIINDNYMFDGYTKYTEYINELIIRGIIKPVKDGEIVIGDDNCYSLEEVINNIIESDIFKNSYYYDNEENKYWINKELYLKHKEYKENNNVKYGR